MLFGEKSEQKSDGDLTSKEPLSCVRSKLDDGLRLFGILGRIALVSNIPIN